MKGATYRAIASGQQLEVLVVARANYREIPTVEGVDSSDAQALGDRDNSCIGKVEFAVGVAVEDGDCTRRIARGNRFDEDSDCCESLEKRSHSPVSAPDVDEVADFRKDDIGKHEGFVRILQLLGGSDMTAIAEVGQCVREAGVENGSHESSASAPLLCPHL